MNKNNQIIFTLNKTKKMIIDLNEPLSKTHCCTYASIIFFDSTNQYILSIESVRENMYALRGLLIKALVNELSLFSLTDQDIGYVWNEELQDRFEINVEHYSLWSYTSATWLYNGQKGSIILEITPVYPWHFRDSHEDENFISYEQWIQTYTPYLIQQIPKNVAYLWLDQANEVLKIIEDNVKKEFNL